MADVLIYGTGKYADKLYKYLLFSGKRDLIKFFVVSEKTEGQDYFHDICVLSFDEIKDSITDYQVYIAMSPDKSMEVKEKLKKHGVQHICEMSREFFSECDVKAEKCLEECPIISNKIFINTYQGKGYCCNTKYLVEFLLKNKYPVEIVWNLNADEANNLPTGVRTVIRDSLEYRYELSSSKILISNDGAFWMTKKKKGQYFINLWHGTGPFKKVNASKDSATQEEIEWVRSINSKFDLFVSNSKDNTEMFREAFLYNGEISEWGSPRIDILFSDTDSLKREIKKKLGIPMSKGVVLYAPTYREKPSEKFMINKLNPKLVMRALGDRFAKDFVFLNRFHHFKKNTGKYSNDITAVLDVTSYDDVMELILIADVLITDYSSIMWDFSLQKRPVFLFHSDLDSYSSNEQNFYWPVDEWPYPRAKTNMELCEMIRLFDREKYLRDLQLFFEKDSSYDNGHACEKLSERIMDVMEYPTNYISNYSE